MITTREHSKKAFWETTILGDEIEKIETTDPRKEPDSEFTYIDVSGVSNQTFQVESAQKLKGKDAPSRARRVVRTGDIIFATVRPTLRRIAMIPPSLNGQVCSTGYFVIRPKPDLISRFAYYFLQSNDFMDRMESLQKGASYPAVTDGEMRSQPIPLPPLPEQERIVAILDEAFEGIATATAHAERNLQNARELFQSVLQSTFEQKGEDWVETTLGEVLEVQPRNGWSPPAANHSETGTPVLTLSSVTGFQFRGNKIKHTSAHTDPNRHYWVRNGDFLITRSNTPELVGHVAIAEGIEEPTIYPDLIMRMNPDPNRAETRFLYYQLRTPSMRDEISGRASGANPTMKKINKSAVQTLPLTLAPLTQQKAIVKKLDALATETRRLEAIYERKLAALAELKQSLLQRAFAGEL